MLAQLTLTPSEGKRLIAKAISCLEQVQQAYKDGIVIIATSTTTAFVAEELMCKELKNKGMFTAGVVTKDGCQITKSDGRYSHFVFEKTKSPPSWPEFRMMLYSGVCSELPATISLICRE